MKDEKKLHFTRSDVQTLRSLCEELDRLQKQLGDKLVRFVNSVVDNISHSSKQNDVFHSETTHLCDY